MRTLKSRFGVIGALVPIFYCGSLIYYFLDLSGSMQEAGEDGLSPTQLGLGVVSLLFAIPLMMKVVRIFTRPRSGPDAPTDDDKSGFDADAAIARYLAQRSTDAPIVSPGRGEPARPSGFGRRTR